MRPHWGLALTVYVAVAAGPAAAQAPVTQAPPSFEVVALPGEGTIVSGSAAPGATVHVLDRERVVATAIANRRGEWAIGLANELSPGSYRLAVRVTAPDGGEAVISDRRIALVVPEPGTAAPSAALPDKIVVQEGDNLWFIARRLYGSGIYFDLLFDANRGIISSPRAIFPGQILAVPIAPSLPH